VRIWLEENRLHLRICDDGPGFADPLVLPERRLRLDEHMPGHGIGLTVVSDLVASHHGKLTLSRAELGGAQIDVVLRAA
jgi:two-component system sensor histidine kinase PhoQ